MTLVAPLNSVGPHAADHPEVRAPGEATKPASTPATSFLTPLQFALAWIVVLALRLACTAYLLVFSFASAALATPQMEYYASLVAPTSLSVLIAASWTTNAIALAHVFKIARAVVASILVKELTFYGLQTSPHPNKRSQNAKARCRIHVACVKQAFAWLLGRSGFFGVESQHFETVFLSRELLEVVSQSVQAHSSSMFIARHWLNALFVAVIFVNSFSTPLVQHFSKRSQAHKRLACLAADLMLDAMTTMVIPLIIMTPYARAFDMADLMINNTILYDVPQYVSLVMETRQVFVRNVFELVTIAASHLSLFSCLGGIQALLQPARKAVHSERLRSISPAPAPILSRRRLRDAL